MTPALEYITIMRPKHPDFIATMTPEEKTVMGEHLAYASQLYDRGKILIGGAATDGSIGILVLRVDSAEEAQAIHDNDPAVRAGIGYTEIHPFRVGLFSGL